MRVLSTAAGTARHGIGAVAEAAVIVAIGAALVFGAAVLTRSDPAGAAGVYAAKGGNGGGDGTSFTLSVDHPDGTTLNENEVVYYAEKSKGGSANGDYAVVHQCFSAGALVTDVTKRLWFPSAFKGPGTAYFLAFGDTCTAVVVDLAGSSDAGARAATTVSNTVTYGTNPLP